MLNARGISFSYDGSQQLFREWSAEFLAGEVVAITGPSGRGKSTLLYILGLMLHPEAGEVRIDGNDALGLSDRARAHLRATTFGFVFQDAALDTSRTVIDNIVETALYRQEPLALAKKRASELMTQFGVELKSGAKPGEVSGGQAQRIALCRALLGNPRILLADEPTGNLDPGTAGIVFGALQSHARSGAAVVVVTHDPSLVAQCDRVVTL